MQFVAIIGLAIASVTGVSDGADIEPESVAIVVVDEQNQPIPLAEIDVSGSCEIEDGLTDDQGAYSFQVSRDCLDSLTFEVSVVNLDVVSFDYRSARDSGFRLKVAPQSEASAEIVVRGRKISTQFAGESFRKLDILTSAASRSDALLAVANLPFSTNTENSADVQLRGSAAGLSRVYFNDVPLYEVVRGSTIDRVTRGFSVFNASIVQQVEVYPTNPPVYLSNVAAGAVRILPDDGATGVSSLFFGANGAGLTKAIPLSGGRSNFVQLYGSVNDLSGLLELNPALRRITKSFRSAALGANAHFDTADGVKVSFLNVLDGESGVFPFRVLASDAITRSKRLRSYNVISLEKIVGEARIKIDGAYTNISGRQAFDAFNTKTNNNYAYTDVNIAGSYRQSLLIYRAGVSTEYINLKSIGTDFRPVDQQVGQISTLNNISKYTSIYGYITYKSSNLWSVALGSRQSVLGALRPEASYQASISISTSDDTQKIVLGIGRYGALVPPEIAARSSFARARSEQISFDYRFDDYGVKASAGIYFKTDIVDGVSTDIRGFDLSASGSLISKISVTGSFVTAQPIVKSPTTSNRGDNYLSYLFRLSVKIAIDGKTSANINYVRRNGTVFTEVVDAIPIANSTNFIPIFSPQTNNKNLKSFEVVDVNLVRSISIWPGARKPIGFVSISNLLDRRNEARAIYNQDFSTLSKAFFERRSFTFGLVFQL
jgi:hypothetical protein